MSEITAGDLNGWLLFEEQDPAGWMPEWTPFSHLMSWMAATHPFSPRDVPPKAFLPGPAVKSQPQTSVERAASIRAGGGMVVQPPPLILAKPKARG